MEYWPWKQKNNLLCVPSLGHRAQTRVVKSAGALPNDGTLGNFLSSVPFTFARVHPPSTGQSSIFGEQYCKLFFAWGHSVATLVNDCPLQHASEGGSTATSRHNCWLSRPSYFILATETTPHMQDKLFKGVGWMRLQSNNTCARSQVAQDYED